MAFLLIGRRFKGIFNNCLTYRTSAKVFVTCLLIASHSMANVSKAAVLLEHDTWQLISFPASAENLPVDSILDSDVLELGVDWALVQYEFESNSYIQAQSDSVIVSGDGYWVKQITGQPVSLIDLVPHTVSLRQVCITYKAWSTTRLNLSNLGNSTVTTFLAMLSPPTDFVVQRLNNQTR